MIISEISVNTLKKRSQLKTQRFSQLAKTSQAYSQFRELKDKEKNQGVGREKR